MRHVRVYLEGFQRATEALVEYFFTSGKQLELFFCRTVDGSFFVYRLLVRKKGHFLYSVHVQYVRLAFSNICDLSLIAVS